MKIFFSILLILITMPLRLAAYVVCGFLEWKSYEGSFWGTIKKYMSDEIDVLLHPKKYM